MIINTLPLYNPQQVYSNNKKIQSFGTNLRSYNAQNGEEMGCISWLFRNDVDWKKLAKYEINNFDKKEKVNIIQFACSDGSEAYTQIMSLFEAMTYQDKDDAKKFFPIRAYDIDEEILSAAKSGYINTNQVDRMNLQMHCDDYTEYLRESTNPLNIQNDKPIQRPKTFKAKRLLTDNVIFEKADMFSKVKEIKDDSNTIVLCRNCLGYFENDKIKEFVKSLSNVLKPNSLFVIGNHDTQISLIENYLEKYGFEKVMQNVYKKT